MIFDRPHKLPDRPAADLRSPSLIIVVVLAFAGIVAYAGFLLNPENRGNPLPYALVIVAETVLIVQALLSMWTILSGRDDPRDFEYYRTRDHVFASADGSLPAPQWQLSIGGRDITVDVFVTVYGEDPTIVDRTIRAALALRGTHEVWLLDDGNSDAMRDLAERRGARYLRRLSNNGAKAGNINHALSVTQGEFFAIFDADFVPHPDFLVQTIPFFARHDVAFVQTPQVYGNMRSFISRGAGYMQSIFYRLVQPGRNAFNAAFCVGTNVVFRRTAINDVGGMYTDSKSEDVWTSLLLHERRWRSVYIPTVLAVGDAPETIEDFTKQQLRWATGGFEILFTHNPLSPRRRLTLDQRLQYFVTATHYFIGIMPLLLLLVPPLEIYFDIRPVNLQIPPETWLFYYLGFYGMQVLLALAIAGSFRVETLLLSSVSFPIYTRALFNVLMRREQSWHVTGGSGRRSSPFNFMVPQLLVFAFLLPTSAVAIYKDVLRNTVTLAAAWNITNTVIIGAFIVTGVVEARRLRREARVADPVRQQRLEPRFAPSVEPVSLPVATRKAA